MNIRKPFCVFMVAAFSFLLLISVCVADDNTARVKPSIIVAYCDGGKTKVVQEDYPRGSIMTIEVESGNKYFVGGFPQLGLIVGFYFLAVGEEEDVRISEEEWLERLTKESQNFYLRSQRKENDCRKEDGQPF